MKLSVRRWLFKMEKVWEKSSVSAVCKSQYVFCHGIVFRTVLPGFFFYLMNFKREGTNSYEEMAASRCYKLSDNITYHVSGTFKNIKYNYTVYGWKHKVSFIDKFNNAIFGKLLYYKRNLWISFGVQSVKSNPIIACSIMFNSLLKV